jgi:putative tryptophan/tyrosine transport system substrate-binding protein
VVNVRNREEVAQGLDSLGSAHIDAVNALASPILNDARGFIVERLNQMPFPRYMNGPRQLRGGRASWLRNPPTARASTSLRTRRQDPAWCSAPKPPIEQPAKFDFVVNLKTAKEIGLTIPSLLLFRADQVIK